jgi:hypothetical protein
MSHIKEACEQFLAGWDRLEWMQVHDEGDRDGETLYGNRSVMLDPDDVNSTIREYLGVRHYDPAEGGWGWNAYRSGNSLYIVWYRHMPVQELWVCVDAEFFAGEH